MDVQAMEHQLCTGGIEVLILNLPHGAAVRRIGIVSAKAPDIKPVGASANLLVGREANLQGGMAASLGNQILGCGQDFCHARLVVRPQQGGAVGDNQVLAPAVFQNGIVIFPEINLLFFIQKHIFPIIGDNLRPDVCAGGIRGSIHVGNQSNGGQAGIAGDSAIDITVFIHAGIRNAHGFHILHQLLPQCFLLFGGGAGFRQFIGLGIKGDISQEALCNCFHGIFSLL